MSKDPPDTIFELGPCFGVMSVTWWQILKTAKFRNAKPEGFFRVRNETKLLCASTIRMSMGKDPSDTIFELGLYYDYNCVIHLLSL